MNCDYDYDQPKLYALYAYRQLRPHYADHPDNLRLRIYPAGHEVTDQMRRDAIEWFRNKLL